MGTWKISLGGHIDTLMREVDPDSANLFGSYIYNASKDKKERVSRLLKIHSE